MEPNQPPPAAEVPIRKRTLVKAIRTVLGSFCVRVFVFIVIGIYVGEAVEQTEFWLDARYRIFQGLQRVMPRGADVQRTVMVMIGDQEYYRPDGELQRRSPIRRDYLGKLVDQAAAAGAAVIALDFTLSSPDPGGNPVELPQYTEETKQLVEAIKRAANNNRRVVLTQTVRQEGENSGQETYVPESDIYGPDLAKLPNISSGFHVLPDDIRNLPLALRSADGDLLESFSLKIARADDAAVAKALTNLTDVRYAGFIPQSEYPSLSADELLNGSDKTRLIANRVVIISGAWHQFGINRGPVVTAWDTPVGSIPGAYIHANYFESLFDKRFYRVWGGWPKHLAEAFLALLVAVALHAKSSSRSKRAAIIASPYLAIVVITYVSLINFGWFFDPFIPVLSVTGHGIVETIWENRRSSET